MKVCRGAGIVSCMASNEDGSGVLAAGAYSGDAAVLDERTGELLYVLQGQKGGITQVHVFPSHCNIETTISWISIYSMSPDGLQEETCQPCQKAEQLESILPRA